MVSEGNTFFKKLNEAEKQSFVQRFLASTSPEITIWKKGEQKKCTSLIINHNNVNEFNFSNSASLDLTSGEVLYTFSLNGMHFFGKGTFEKNQDFCRLRVVGDLFKSERRASFRLLTYPHDKVYAQIQLTGQERESGNVINLATGANDTGLFKNFLKMVGGDTKEETIKEGYTRFRVLDLSATGISIQFGEIEEPLIELIKENLGELTLELRGEQIVIPGAELLYKTSFIAQDRTTKMYKGGVQFKFMSEDLDQQLTQKIYKLLKSRESEFEDFV